MEIKKIAVLGAGIMGAGIAQISAQAGFDVIIRDIEERFVEKGLAGIQKILDRSVSKGRLEESAAAAIMGRISGTTDLQKAVLNVDLVIEAII
ncbi:MAG: 3-hydroxybutyryl-CoA dehydrogenase, partial [Deltaproteobacteria bacterium]|nr:3-hydroxybutyryl-CoA dehydrogenase [Deltaproteobacteria bacterium]